MTHGMICAVMMDVRCLGDVFVWFVTWLVYRWWGKHMNGWWMNESMNPWMNEYIANAEWLCAGSSKCILLFYVCNVYVICLCIFLVFLWQINHIELMLFVYWNRHEIKFILSYLARDRRLWYTTPKPQTWHLYRVDLIWQMWGIIWFTKWQFIFIFLFREVNCCAVPVKVFIDKYLEIFPLFESLGKWVK